MKKAWLFGMLVSVIGLSGCVPDSEEKIQSTTEVEEVGESVRLRGVISIGMNEPGLIQTYYEAKLYSFGEGETKDQAVEVATYTDPEIGHTNGVSNQFDFVMDVPNYLETNTYYLISALYDSEGKNVQLYEGTCDQGGTECTITTLGSSVKTFVGLNPVTDYETIKKYGVPEEIRAKCFLAPNTDTCGEGYTGSYYDQGKSQCTRHRWDGCGEAPFENVLECQQACL